MIVDAHHHLWKIDRGDYGWLDPRRDASVTPIARDFLVSEYSVLARRHDVSASILVQAAPSDAETDWLLEQARASDGFVRGVVGWVDLAAPQALQRLERLAREPLLRALRPMLQDLEPPDWVLDARLAPALRASIALGLRFDILVRRAQRACVLPLLQRYPDLSAVIDHGAKPDIAGGEWQPWADQMAAIARESAALCKLSGLVTEAGPGWSVARLRPYVAHLLACFGPDRLMWGSDWPVVLLASEYTRWMDATAELLHDLSAQQRASVMGGNALRFYGIGA